ncbi:phasin family protein [Cobetia marina]|jgi:phasin family protein|nr:phasin family protein [Cobetia marina]
MLRSKDGAESSARSSGTESMGGTVMQQDQMFNAFAEQARSFYQPMRKLNSLVLDHMSKVAEFQMDAAKRYADTGFERARAATEVKSVEQLSEFGNRQLEVATELSQQMMDDSLKLAEMGNEMRSQMEQAYSDAGKEATDKASSAASKASSATADAAKDSTSKPASATSRAKQS